MSKIEPKEEYMNRCPYISKTDTSKKLCYRDNQTKDIYGCFGNCEYMRNYNISLLKNKVIFIDLDGTLINTISGEKFPKGVWDMKLNFPLLDILKGCKPTLICIVTNQGGIGTYISEIYFKDKFTYIKDCIREYTGCECHGIYCSSNDKENRNRKPNTGMLEYFSMLCDIKKEDCIMIGDASGLEGQFSDSDKKTADNFGIPYLDVNEVVKSTYDKNITKFLNCIL